MSDKFYQSQAVIEWYTPAYIIDAARDMLGQIDLDPASCAEANETVRANHYFTVEQDGLAQRWYGAVWMNPPYGRGIGPFIQKLATEYRDGDVAQAVALVPARTDTKWFQPLWGCDALCFIRGRLRYPQSSVSSPFPSVLAYFGPWAARFSSIFGPFGTVVYPQEVAA